MPWISRAWNWWRARRTLKKFYKCGNFLSEYFGGYVLIDTNEKDVVIGLCFGSYADRIAKLRERIG